MTDVAHAGWLSQQSERPATSGRPTWLAPKEVPTETASFGRDQPSAKKGSANRRSVAPLASRPPSMMPPSPLGDSYERPDSDEVPPPPSMPEAESLALHELMNELRDTLDQAQLATEQARRDILAQAEPEIVKLAIAVAERVIGRELRLDPQVISLWVKEGVGALVQEDAVEVRVSPQLAEQIESLRSELEPAQVANIVVSDQLSGPAIEVVGRYGKVDAGLKARLAAIVEALGAEES